MINNDDVTTTNTMVYDIGTGTTGKIENAANVCVSGDKLLFNIKGEDRKTVYMSDLDGGNVTETSLTMEDDNGLLCAYDNVVIGTNLIDYSVQAAKDGTFKQVFRVYKDNELKAEFSIDNVNGIDYSKNVISTILVTEKYVMVVLPDGAVAIMNKSDFEQGKIEPVIINI